MYPGNMGENKTALISLSNLLKRQYSTVRYIKNILSILKKNYMVPWRKLLVKPEKVGISKSI